MYVPVLAYDWSNLRSGRLLGHGLCSVLHDLYSWILCPYLGSTQRRPRQTTLCSFLRLLSANMSRSSANSIQLILIYGCCYSATLPLIKTAILLDWCRIFFPIDRTRNAFWCGCMAVATLQCVWGLLCIILLNMQCRPHEAIWKFYLPSRCYSLPDVMLTSASVQVASDIIMFVLPQRIIWHLQMTWQKKLGISVIFGVGILSVHATLFAQ